MSIRLMRSTGRKKYIAYRYLSFEQFETNIPGVCCLNITHEIGEVKRPDSSADSLVPFRRGTYYCDGKGKRCYHDTK